MLLERTDRTDSGSATMPGYRAIRPGDLIAVRTNHPDDEESHVVLHTVADNGSVIFLAGAWRDRDLEIVVRRVGDTQPASS